MLTADEINDPNYKNIEGDCIGPFIKRGKTTLTAMTNAGLFIVMLDNLET
jgi:hypothetical protein